MAGAKNRRKMKLLTAVYLTSGSSESGGQYLHQRHGQQPRAQRLYPGLMQKLNPGSVCLHLSLSLSVCLSI